MATDRELRQACPGLTSVETGSDFMHDDGMTSKKIFTEVDDNSDADSAVFLGEIDFAEWRLNLRLP